MIAQRLVRKAWFVEAFRILRLETVTAGGAWPVDAIRRRDNHGEFFNVAWLAANQAQWLPALRHALVKSSTERDTFALEGCGCSSRTSQPPLDRPHQPSTPVAG